MEIIAQSKCVLCDIVTTLGLAVLMTFLECCDILEVALKACHLTRAQSPSHARTRKQVKERRGKGIKAEVPFETAKQDMDGQGTGPRGQDKRELPKVHQEIRTMGFG